jgi:hypothetical protein
LGVIDVLSQGFRHVHRHWWILLIPIVLDTFLWLGPQAAIDDLVGEALRVLEANAAEVDTGVQPDGDWLGDAEALAQEYTPHYNGLSALRVGAIGIPSLTTWGGARLGSPSSYEILWVAFLLITDMPDTLVPVSTATFYQPPVWQIPTGVAWLLLVLALTGIGILIGGAYFAAIASAIDGQRDLWTRLRHFVKRFALFWVLRLILVVGMGIPMLLLSTALYALSPGLASLFTTVLLGLVTWLSFYGIFFIASLALQDVSIWRALWNSFNVVLRNFWPTVALFVLINLIGGGLTILWQQLSSGSWLTLLGIVGNAYIGTSLITASLIYYRDRYTRWQELLAELLRRGRRLA